MAHAQWLLELVLILLLAGTLFHAMRLERALGVLKRDRAVLEELVAGFNESTRQAESGIDRLRAAADGAGRQIGKQIEQAQLLRDELDFLADRSDKLAQRLESAIRTARMVPESQNFSTLASAAPGLEPVASDTSGTLSFGRLEPRLEPRLDPAGRAASQAAGNDDGAADIGRLRSQAERDLLRALRGGR
jgi:ABC-type transporter Mla subunit MlaD